MWPLLASIHNFPYSLQITNILFFGLWSGFKKPNIQLFLSPFIDIFTNLSTNGILLSNNVRVFFHVSIFSCDTIARALVFCRRQFNGYNGCHWCSSRGERVPKGRGSCMTYPFSDVSMNCRSNTDFFCVNVVEGFLDISPLVRVPNFDCVNGTVVDNLHCIELGVMKAMFSFWFDSCYSGSIFSIRRNCTVINNLLSAISVPSNIRRTPRSLSCIKHWKGVEFFNFLVFYGPVILCDILLPQFFDHFILLSNVVFMLNNKVLSESVVNEATLLVNRFVYEFPGLYGRENMSYNVHQLLHLPSCARLWGPLLSYSCHQFENFNGIILSFLNGTQDISTQVIDRFSYLTTFKLLILIL